MSRAAKTLLLSAVLGWALLLNIYHIGVLPPPKLNPADQGSAEFIPKEKAGLNHLILKGSPYMRGLHAGRMTKHLLLSQEEVLIEQLQAWIPRPWMLQLGIAGLITYFYGADKFVESDDLLEMYGTSQSAPEKFKYLADGYTRQLAYHGLHEVGQMMVDRGIDMGCTVVAVPEGKGWIVGRNFDFEGGRVFDSDKLVKWVYPDQGYAHVSVIWAGMVGGVTGVNEKGVYISLNAAGSNGFRRAGTPSTLILYKVLKQAANADEAIKILRDAHMFITDIFVVGDAAGRLVKVEKSPQKTEVITATGPFAVANHLSGRIFENDSTNTWRMRELTSLTRESRALNLARNIEPNVPALVKTEKILGIMRDKGMDERGQPLHLGSRLAIDALIATHAVIWDSSRGIFYIGQGPSLAGKFIAFDLARSFAEQNPIRNGELAADSRVTAKFYDNFKDGSQQITVANRLHAHQKCAEALEILKGIPLEAQEQEPFYHSLGNVHACLKKHDLAVAAWRKAYSLRPAYASWRRALEKKLGTDMEAK